MDDLIIVKQGNEKIKGREFGFGKPLSSRRVGLADDRVYTGRQVRSRPDLIESPLANKNYFVSPNVTGEEKYREHQKAVDAYKPWLSKQIELGKKGIANPQFTEVDKLTDLVLQKAAAKQKGESVQPVVLTCWCPQGYPCHASAVREKVLERAIEKETGKMVAPPLNINTNCDDWLGAALTNTTENAKYKLQQKGVLVDSNFNPEGYPVSYGGDPFRAKTYEHKAEKYLIDKPEGVPFVSAEDAYKHFQKSVNQQRWGELMTDIVAHKLVQHSELMQEIEERGGVKWLETCSHTTPANGFWEGEGRGSKFIQSLIAGFELAQSISAESQKKDELKASPETITSLAPNQVFVFGSNVDGIHGAGAARRAFGKYSERPSKGTKGYWAVFGQGEGYQEGKEGASYAIATKDLKQKSGSQKVPLPKIAKQIDRFLKFAKSRPDKEFLVTKIGCGLAGYSESEIAALWQGKDIPNNVLLPQAFVVERSSGSNLVADEPNFSETIYTSGRRFKLPLEDNTFTVVFSGSRSQSFDRQQLKDVKSRIDKMVKSTLEKAKESGFDKVRFITGMALGVDQMAAQSVIEAFDRGKNGNVEIELVAAVPCKNQDKIWKDTDRHQYREILSRCDRVHHVSTDAYHSPSQLFDRNEWMIDQMRGGADLLLAFQANNSRGTQAAIDYAVSKGETVIKYDADSGKLRKIKNPQRQSIDSPNLEKPPSTFLSDFDKLLSEFRINCTKLSEKDQLEKISIGVNDWTAYLKKDGRCIIMDNNDQPIYKGNLLTGKISQVLSDDNQKLLKSAVDKEQKSRQRVSSSAKATKQVEIG